MKDCEEKLKGARAEVIKAIQMLNEGHVGADLDEARKFLEI